MAERVPLESSWLFEGLAPEVQARIKAFSNEERFDAGATIFSEGDTTSNLFVLGEGIVELSCVLPGRNPVTLRISRIAPGEVFGWSALALGERLTADAVAITNCAAYLVPTVELFSVLDSDPKTGYRVMSRLSQLIAKRLRDTRTELRWMHSSM